MIFAARGAWGMVPVLGGNMTHRARSMRPIHFTLALIPALTGDFVQVDNLARAINFGCNKVRFYTPVPVDSRVRARATVLQARQRAGALHLLSEIKVEVDGERKPACVAETLGIYIFND